MAELLSSKVTVIEEPPRVRGIVGAPTAVAGAVGIAERGPVGEPVLVTSFAEYQRVFGGFTAQADLALAAMGFFQNGGNQLHVVRTVHYSNPADGGEGTSARASAALLADLDDDEVVLRVQAQYVGAYGNRLSVETRAPSNGQSGLFDLSVYEGGVPRETFANVSMSPTHPRYVVAVVNHSQAGSGLVRVVDGGLANAPAPPAQVLFLAGGSDGLASLNDADFVGSETGRTGLRALDVVPDLTLVLVPGRATATVHAAMIHYCEWVRAGAAFAILDPPAGARATQMVAYVGQAAGLEGASEYGALYWPRIRIPNPDRAAFGPDDQVVAPPSGVIAGVFARTDGARPGGVYDAPAGVEKGRMQGVLGFETTECNDERKRDLVYPRRINPLRTDSNAPRYIDGSRTLKGDGNFPSIPERRGVSFIERSLRQGLESARHRANDERLRAEVRNTVTAFLITQMNLGAFASRDPSTAFYVAVSDSVQERLRGELHVEVGLATNKPAEFIVLHISQDTRALETAIAPN